MAMNVKTGNVSPSLTSTKFIAACKADVPFTVAIAYFAPVYSQIIFSNSVTLAPTIDKVRIDTISQIFAFITFKNWSMEVQILHHKYF